MSKSICIPLARRAIPEWLGCPTWRFGRAGNASTALLNSGFGYPNKTLTINLAPANVRKEGAGFDLPVAIGILDAMAAVRRLDRHLLMGELSLDGALRPVRGALSVVVCARDRGIPNLIVPAEKAAEAAVVDGVSIYGMRHLAEVVALLTRPVEFMPTAPPTKRHCGGIGGVARFWRRPEPNHGQASARSGRGGLAQYAYDRGAWGRAKPCSPSGEQGSQVSAAWPAFCRP